MNPKSSRKKEPFVYPACHHVMSACFADHWIMCAPVVSTSHITKQDHDILEFIKPASSSRPDLLFASTGSGWIVHLGCVGQNDLIDAGFSGQFVNLLQIFFDAGYKFLRLDADGDVLNLPTSDW